MLELVDSVTPVLLFVFGVAPGGMLIVIVAIIGNRNRLMAG